MKTRYALIVSILALLPHVLVAQKWEVGGVGGGSFYTSSDVTRSTGKADAKFAPGFAAGVLIGQDMGRYWGGDIRYTYQRNNAELSGAGGKASFGAESHAIHYDALLHFASAGARTRPFLSVGAGVKFYRGTGTETITQALSEYALLTKTTDLRPVVTFGAGIKVRVGARSNLRIEVKDYFSPVPEKLIQPNRGAEVSGWIHNFVPMIAISYVF